MTIAPRSTRGVESCRDLLYLHRPATTILTCSTATLATLSRPSAATFNYLPTYIMPHIDAAGCIIVRVQWSTAARQLRLRPAPEPRLHNGHERHRSIPLRWSVYTIGRSVGASNPTASAISPECVTSTDPSPIYGRTRRKDARLMNAEALEAAPWRLYLCDTARL